MILWNGYDSRVISREVRMNKNHQFPAILLIERDEVTLEIYQRELIKSFNVYASTEINKALEVLATQDIVAVVIEPETSSGRGWELIDMMHKDSSTQLIPVIISSTRDPSSETSSRGITKYLIKPVLPKTLREKVLEVLRTAKIQPKTS